MKYYLVGNKKEELVTVDVSMNKLMFIMAPVVKYNFCEGIEKPLMDLRLEAMQEYIDICTKGDYDKISELENKTQHKVNILLLEEIQKLKSIGIASYITLGA